MDERSLYECLQASLLPRKIVSSPPPPSPSSMEYLDRTETHTTKAVRATLRQEERGGSTQWCLYNMSLNERIKKHIELPNPLLRCKIYFTRMKRRPKISKCGHGRTYEVISQSPSSADLICERRSQYATAGRRTCWMHRYLAVEWQLSELIGRNTAP